MPRLSTETTIALVVVPAAVLAVAGGALSADETARTLGRTLPVLAFLLLMTVAAEQCGRMGLFDHLADLLARAGRGRRALLLVTLAATAVACTTLLSLDTTAVLLTPVAITLSRRLGLAVLPSALVCLWLANTASLLLPVANLTSLLAARTGGWSAAGFLAHMWLPQLGAVTVTLAVTAAVHRRHWRGGYAIPRGTAAAGGSFSVTLGGNPSVALADSAVGASDRPSPGPPAAALSVFGVAVLCGAPPWAAAAGLVTALTVIEAVTAPAGRLSPAGLSPIPLHGAIATAGRRAAAAAPWAMTAAVGALFVLMAAVTAHWGADLQRIAGSGEGAAGRLRMAWVGAGAANAVDNLPAYLALEPAVASDRDALAALLVGVNVGPLVTPWASLAWLLWWQACRRAGVRVPLGRVMTEGLAVGAIGVTVAALLL